MEWEKVAKGRRNESYDNLNYGQEKCNKGDDLIRTGTLINIPRGSEGVDVIDSDFQTQRSRDGGNDYEASVLKLEKTNIISRLVPLLATHRKFDWLLTKTLNEDRSRVQ